MFGKLSILVVSTILGVVFQQYLFAQDQWCDKCCGLSVSNGGIRYSAYCPQNECQWRECANAPVTCSGYGITCSGAYAQYSDACAGAQLKCPAQPDQPAGNACRNDCRMSF